MRIAVLLASSTGGIGRHVASLVTGLTAPPPPPPAEGPPAPPTTPHPPATDRDTVTATATSNDGTVTVAVSDGDDAATRSVDDVIVYGPADTERQFRFTSAGATFRPVEIPAKPHPRDVKAVGLLRRAWRRDRPDVVHAHGLRAGLVAALALPRGCPLVVTWHNLVVTDGAPGGVKARVLALLERVVAGRADITLCASEDLVSRVLSLGGRDVRLGAVAAPPLPAARRPAEEIRAELGAGDRPLILSVGRLHPQKGYDVLIDAAARWRELDPVPLVVIAGSGPAHDELAARITATGAPVTLLGHRDDVADLLPAADLAVVTSVWEARQLFAQEALRAGRALVSTAVGGIPGLVGDAALLVPAGSVEAVDTAVRRLLADEGLRYDLGRRGPARAATWPTDADTVAQARAVYREVAG